MMAGGAARREREPGRPGRGATRRGELAHHPDGAPGEQGSSDHRQARGNPPRVTAVLGEGLTEPAPHACHAITSLSGRAAQRAPPATSAPWPDRVRPRARSSVPDAPCGQVSRDDIRPASSLAIRPAAARKSPGSTGRSPRQQTPIGVRGGDPATQCGVSSAIPDNGRFRRGRVTRGRPTSSLAPAAAWIFPPDPGMPALTAAATFRISLIMDRGRMREESSPGPDDAGPRRGMDGEMRPGTALEDAWI